MSEPRKSNVGGAETTRSQQERVSGNKTIGQIIAQRDRIGQSYLSTAKRLAEQEPDIDKRRVEMERQTNRMYGAYETANQAVENRKAALEKEIDELMESRKNWTPLARYQDLSKEEKRERRRVNARMQAIRKELKELK